MKTIDRIFITVVCLVLLVNTDIFALENQLCKEEKVIFVSEEIKDENIILERAINGITDYDINIKNEGDIQYYAKNLENGAIDEQVETVVYSTTQLLRKTEKAGNKTDYYATNLVALTKIKDDGFAERASYQMSDWLYDSSISVKSYSTIYWTKSNMLWINDEYVEYAQYHSCEGHWSIVDSQVSITNRYIQARSKGINLDENEISYTEYASNFPNTNAGSTFSTGFDRYATSSASFNAKNVCTLNRGTSSWSFATTMWAGYLGQQFDSGWL